MCVRPEHLRICTDNRGITGTVEMGLPLGAMIVHEIRTADGQAIKITEPRSAGTEPRSAGTAVRIEPLSADHEIALTVDEHILAKAIHRPCAARLFHTKPEPRSKPTSLGF